MNTLGEKLKKLRKDKRWTIKEVAKKLGLKGYSTYSNWEYDLREPDLETVARIAELYEVDPNYLMPNSSEKSVVRVAILQRDDDKMQDSIELTNKDHNENLDMIMKDIDLSNDDLLKKYKFVYKGSEFDEEKTKQLIAFIRFLAQN